MRAIGYRTRGMGIECESVGTKFSAAAVMFHAGLVILAALQQQQGGMGMRIGNGDMVKEFHGNSGGGVSWSRLLVRRA
jgi:hypothetical protein